MADSPAFARTYDLLQWLIPRTLKFPRVHRFGLVARIHTAAYAVQRALVEAALAASSQQESAALQRADVELAELRLLLRLSHDLSLLDDAGYEHSSGIRAEIGRLLGGWKKAADKKVGTKGQP